MYTRILVPVDGSPTAQYSLQEAIRVAMTMHSTLVLLHVVEDAPPEISAILQGLGTDPAAGLRREGATLLSRAASAAAECGITTESVLCEASGRAVGDVVVAQIRAQRCAFVVIGAHGRRGRDRLTMGHDAELVVRQSPVPVMLVRRVRGDDD
jgi:nucleotide-binding universal stress UspA family protein